MNYTPENKMQYGIAVAVLNLFLIASLNMPSSGRI